MKSNQTKLSTQNDSTTQNKSKWRKLAAALVVAGCVGVGAVNAADEEYKITTDTTINASKVWNTNRGSDVLTIDGSSKILTLSATAGTAPNGGVIWADNLKSVVVKDITLTGGNILETDLKWNHGGAGFHAGYGTVASTLISLSNVTVTNNKAATGAAAVLALSGGGVHIHGTELADLKDVTIKNNTLTTVGSTAAISNAYGGGLYVFGSDAVKITATDGAKNAISENTATSKMGAYGGGAAFAYSAEDWSPAWGAGIPVISVSDTTFDKNIATATETGGQAWGGGVYIGNALTGSNATKGKFEFKDTTFTGNEAKAESGSSAGGGMFVSQSNAGVQPLTLTGVTFGEKDEDGDVSNGNKATGSTGASGGAIFVLGGQGDVTFKDVNIYDSEITAAAVTGGGAGVALVNKFTFTGGEVIGNKANGNTEAADNTVIGGGGLYLYKVDTIAIDKVDFTGNSVVNANTCITGGGALFIDNNSMAGNITITDTNFKNNSAIAGEGGTAQGGAIWTNNNITIAAVTGDVTFEGNYTQVGSDDDKVYNDIYLANGAKLTLEAATGKTITLGGGVVNDNSDIDIKGDGTITFGAGSTTSIDGTITVTSTTGGVANFDGVAEAGALVINTTGATVNTTGTLELVDNRSGGGGAGTITVTSGTLNNAGTLTAAGDVTIAATGTLNITETGSVTTTGDVTVAGTLGFVGGGTGAQLTADSVTFDTDSVLNITGVGADGTNDIIKLTGGGTVDLDNVTLTIAGTDVDDVDFLIASVETNKSGNVELTTGLTWNLTDGTQHGDFTIAADNSFDISAALENGTAVTPVTSTSWDGKTLTKKGDGTLILSSDANTYSGKTDIQAGTLKAGIADAIKTSSAVSISTGSTFDMGGTDQTLNKLAGAGSIINSVTTTGGTPTLTLHNALATTDDTEFEGTITATATEKIAIDKTGLGKLTLSNSTTGNTLTSVKVSGGTLVNTGKLTTGDVTVNGANSLLTLGVASVNTISGAITASGGGTFEVVKGAGFEDTAPTGLKLDNGTFKITGIGYDNAPLPITLGTGGGTIDVAATSGDLILTSRSNITSTSAGGDALTIKNSVGTHIGKLILDAGKTNTIGALNIGANSALENQGTLTATDVTVSGAKSLVTLASGSTNTISGVITASNGGTFEVANGAKWGAAPTSISLNDGTLKLTGAGTTSIASTVPLTLAGTTATVDVTDATGIGAIHGKISGTQLTKTGAGTLVLNGDNDYTGGTTINAGTVEIGHNKALGTSGVTLTGAATIQKSAVNAGDIAITNTINNGGYLLTANNANPNHDLILGGKISGNGGLTKIGVGDVILSAANDYAGATNINTGTLALKDGGSIAASSSVILTGTSIFDISAITSSTTIKALSGIAGTSVALGGKTLTVGDTSNSASSFAGVISGLGGSLVKAGTGTLTLSGANSYSGGTTINAGVVEVGSNTAFGTGAVTLGGNATIQKGATGSQISISNAIGLSTHTLTVNNADTGADLSFNAGISGTGGLTKTGNGVVYLYGANTYTGTTAVNAGTLRIGGSGSLGTASVNSGAITVASGATLSNGADIYAASLNASNGTFISSAGSKTVITGAANFGTQDMKFDGRFTAQSVTADDVTIANTGVITLTGTGSNITGSTSVAGTLNITGSLNTTGAVSVASGATLGLAIGGTPTLTANSVAFTSGSTLNISSYTEDATAVIKTTSGVTGFSGVNVTIGGSTGVDFLSATAKLANEDKDVEVETSLTWKLTDDKQHGTFTLTNANDSFTIVTALANGQASSTTNWDGTTLTKKGLGTLTLSGANTYTGATTIEAGTLEVKGSLGTNNIYAGAISIATDSTLHMNQAGSQTLSGAISGAGSLEKSGTGTLTLSSTSVSDYGGTTNITGGTLKIASGAKFANKGDVTVDGTTSILELQDGIDFDGSTNENLNLKNGGTLALTKGTGDGDVSSALAITLTGSGKIDVAGDVTATASGVINESAAGASLIKTGLGTLTLSGDNKYTGGTAINSGTVIVSHNNALGATSGGVTMKTGTTLKAGAAVTTANAIAVDAGAAVTLDNNNNAWTVGNVTGTTGTVTFLGDNTTTTGAVNMSTTGGVVIGNGTAGTVVDAQANAVTAGSLSLQAGTASDVTTLTTAGDVTVTNAATLAANTKLKAAKLTVGSYTDASGSVIDLSGLAKFGSDTTIHSTSFKSLGVDAAGKSLTLAALAKVDAGTGGVKASSLFLTMGTSDTTRTTLTATGGDVDVTGAVTLQSFSTLTAKDLKAASYLDASGAKVSLTGDAKFTGDATISSTDFAAKSLEVGGKYTDVASSIINLTTAATFKNDTKISSTFTAPTITAAGKTLEFADGATVKTNNITANSLTVTARAPDTNSLGTNAPIQGTGTLDLSNVGTLYLKTNGIEDGHVAVGDTATRYFANGFTSITGPTKTTFLNPLFVYHGQGSGPAGSFTMTRESAVKVLPKLSESVAASLDSYTMGSNGFIDAALETEIPETATRSLELGYNAAGAMGGARRVAASRAGFSNVMGSIPSMSSGAMVTRLATPQGQLRGQFPPGGFGGLAGMQRSVWVMPQYGHTSSGELMSGGVGYKYRSNQYAVSFGAEANRGALRFGLAGNVGGGNQTSDELLGVRTKSDSFFGGAAGYTSVPLGYVVLNAQFGWIGSQDKVKQQNANGELAATVNGGVTFVNMTFEKPLLFGRFVVTPLVGMEYDYVYQSAYKSEFNGGTAFNASAASANLVTIPVGFKTAYTYVHAGGLFTPEFRARVLPVMGDRHLDYKNTPIGAHLATLRSIIADEVSGDANLGFSWQRGAWDARADYGVQFSQHFTNQNASLMLRWMF